MICYRDKTFCNYVNCENFKNCDRAMNEYHVKKVTEIKLPVCFFADKPDCYKG